MLRPKKLMETVSWTLRGTFETDRVRSYIDGARELLQRRRTLDRRLLAIDNAREAVFQIPRELGYHIIHPDGLGEINALIQYVNSTADGLIFDAKRRLELKHHMKSGKNLIEGNVDPTSLALDNPLLRFALRSDLIIPISTYLGLIPVLRRLDVMVSLPDEPGAPYRKSQLWHCDDSNTTQVKVFLHCRDVDAENGPLELIPAATSQWIRDRLGYRYAGRRYRISDSEMSEHADEAQHIVMTGPLGAICLFDSSRCFHRGSRVQGSNRYRVLGYLQYVIPASMELSLNFMKNAPFRYLAGPELPRLQRLVLGAE